MALARSGQRDAAESERAAAREALDRAIASANDPALLAEMLAMRYQFDAGAGDREQAEKSLARLRMLAPDSPVTAMIVADACVVKQDLAGARVALDHALRFAPTAPELLWLSGMLALESGDTSSAEARFAALCGPSIADPDWILSGRMALAVVRHGEQATNQAAVEQWRDALASDETDATFRMVIDELGSRAAGIEKRLRALCDDAARKFEDDAAIAYAKAYVDRASGFPERALEEIDRILGRGADEFEVDLLWLACQAHHDLDQPGAALVRARALLDRRPWHVEALIGFVDSVMRTAESGPDRDRALAYVKEARTHFESRRRMLIEAADRDTRELRARLAEQDRYLNLLDQMQDALERR